MARQAGGGLLTPTPREQFCAVLSNGPVLKSDAVVVLCGEDPEPRIGVAAQLFAQGAGLWVLLTGGKHEPPRWFSAEKLTPSLLGLGVSHTRVVIDNESMNTREQAVNTVAAAIEKGWKRLLLVASGYHQYRAFLTFLKALQEAEQDHAIQMMMMPANQVQWWATPTGMEQTRLNLLTAEFDKLTEYAGDVASYEAGLEYLEYWETHEPEMEGVELV